MISTSNPGVADVTFLRTGSVFGGLKASGAPFSAEGPMNVKSWSQWFGFGLCLNKFGTPDRLGKALGLLPCTGSNSFVGKMLPNWHEFGPAKNRVWAKQRYNRQQTQ
ncbi:MAG: hypothetical protein ACR2NP_03890, partial [Pirellulaceae bacterium]